MDKKAKWVTKFEEENASFAVEAQALTSEQLKERIVAISRQLEEVAAAKENDEELQKAVEAVKQLKAPYSDAIKVGRQKIKYLLLLLEGGK